MSSKLLISVLLVFFLLSACGYKEGVITSAQKSYLFFTGSTSTVLVSVDGGEQFPVRPGKDKRYSIAPGKHQVLIYRNGNVITTRDIYVGDGVSKEIEVK